MPKIKMNRGFTLIELLASIFIVALLSGVFLVNYHNTNKRSQLKMIIQKLASDIRLAQNNSLGSKNYNDTSAPGGGWGVHFDISNPASYIIFADYQERPNGNQAYEADENTGEEIKILPAGVTVNALSSDGISVNTLDVVFFPPDPITYVNQSSTAKARIELKENINNSTSAVTVNLFGLIDVE